MKKYGEDMLTYNNNRKTNEESKKNKEGEDKTPAKAKGAPGTSKTLQVVHKILMYIRE